MYKCMSCGYKNNLFPQFGKKGKEAEQEDEKTRPSDVELEE